MPGITECQILRRCDGRFYEKSDFVFRHFHPPHEAARCTAALFVCFAISDRFATEFLKNLLTTSDLTLPWGNRAFEFLAWRAHSPRGTNQIDKEKRQKMQQTAAAFGGAGSVFRQFPATRMRHSLPGGRPLHPSNIRRFSSSLSGIAPTLLEFLGLYSGRRAFGNARFASREPSRRFPVESLRRTSGPNLGSPAGCHSLASHRRGAWGSLSASAFLSRAEAASVTASY